MFLGRDLFDPFFKSSFEKFKFVLKIIILKSIFSGNYRFDKKLNHFRS